jgi:aryl-phospho-beta-D-glucosidase BglC (GH1 family)
MSSHGLTWFPLIDLNVNNATNLNTLKQQITFNPTGGTPFPYTSSAVTNLVNQWHVQVIRASMFPYDPWNIQAGTAKSYDNGTYPEWKWYNINLVNAIVQSAINQNIYVIIDWHAGEGNDQDPTQYWNSGHVQEFFDYMVDKWGSYPNVIYETVNSPVVSWNPTLKTFNQNVVDRIRARENTDGYANDNLILVGTPTWSQDIDVATNDPLTGNMIAYNYMWYAGTHVPMGWVQPRGDTALANLAARAPQQTLFMGEVGTSTSDGNGGVYYSNFNTAMEWAKTKKLSWLNWSIANKQESSSIFVPAVLGDMAKNELAWRGGGLAGDGTNIAQAMASTGQPMRMGPWNPADLSCSGKFIQGWMLYNTSQATPSGC